MNKKKMNVILYLRVSTEEQRKTGNSLDYQEQTLRYYCQHKNYNVIAVYREDESAKDFENRPEWNKLQKFCNKNRREVDLVLVHKWDRFSRNTKEAYNILDEFKSYGIEINATEQYIDLSIPDSLIMLALYFSTSEVERLKISARIKDCNHQALMSGYFINKAPFGYLNHKLANGKHSLIIDEPKAQYIREAFRRVATGIESAESVRIDLNHDGTKMSKSNFLRMLRKIVYCGKIFVAQHQKNSERIVDGLHDAIIDLKTYYEVQKVLDGKRWKGLVPSHKNEKFPLRNYLVCECCGDNITGSTSKGRSKTYDYYHCMNQHRIPREDLHTMFEEMLDGFSINENIKELYSKILLDKAKDLNSNNINQINFITKEIEKNDNMIDNADERFLSSDIGADSYNRLIEKLNDKNRKLKFELEELSNKENPVDKHLKNSMNLLLNLRKTYTQANYENKRKMIGSIFQDKMIVSKTRVRTTKINKVVELISKGINELGDKKNGTESEKSDSSHYVLEAGLEPARAKRPQDFKSGVSTNSTTRAT